MFGQGIPKGLPTHQNWKHFALYYDGQFNNPMFIAHGFNQLQRASCMRNSARITSSTFNKQKLLQMRPRILATKWRMDIDKSGYRRPHVSDSFSLSVPKTSEFI
jgi:hypothetical protein